MMRWERWVRRIRQTPRMWWTVFVFGMAAALAVGTLWPVRQGAEDGAKGAAGLPGATSASEANTGENAQPGGAAAAGRDRAPGSVDADGGQAGGPLAGVSVRVWLSGEARVETLPLEQYVRGVLAGEMPADFELEALKAQAVAARTYIVKRLKDGTAWTRGTVRADVDDTEDTQVYIPLERLRKEWSAADLDKLSRAVSETAGEVVMYGGEPIEAVFFSTSNGYTENSEDYWNAALPYLRSVPSPWDAALSPRYKDTVTMKLADFYRALGVEEEDGPPSIAVEAYTEGKRIKTLRVGRQRFSGREARERLDLRSSQFTWRIAGDRIELTTYGYGHGIGMSQWGADGLAKEGRTAADILQYYYSGAKVERIAADNL